MSSKTLTRTVLSEAVYRELGLSRAESAELVESVINHICEALIRGEQVKISGFGTFNIRNKSGGIYPSHLMCDFKYHNDPKLF